VYGKFEPVKDKEDGEGDTAEKEGEEGKVKEEDRVFPTQEEVAEGRELSISEVISQRVSAVRQLESNPNSYDAKLNLHRAQRKLDSWSKTRMIPGQFTGSTGLTAMSKSELNKGKQPWANTGTFNTTRRVGGVGKALLEKMGWQEGQALGKSMVGALEPLHVKVKTDRKGLSSMMEMAPRPPPLMKQGPLLSRSTVKDLSCKHPVSALMEICSKRRWPAPDYTLLQDSGPDHHRNFRFKVTVNNQEYHATQPSLNKKLAKAHVSHIALQSMGLVPR